MDTAHTAHRRLATRSWPAATLVVALAASAAPLAQTTTESRMTAALAGMNGANGWLLKKGTTVLSSQNADDVFEPASAIKFIIDLKAELMIQSNWVSPATPISGTNLYSGSCPIPSLNTWTEPLEDAMSKMMWASDNSRTEALVEYFGVGPINAAAYTLGAVDTRINHRHGCAADALAHPNETTLNDLTTLYRKAFTTELLTAPRRQHMWARMPNQLDELKEAANLEAWSSYGQVLTGPPKAFKDNLKVAFKAGGYKLCVGWLCTQYRAIAGYVEIPVRTAYGTILPQKYTFGIFIHKAIEDEDEVDAAFALATRELFRDEIRKAMGTFF